MDFSIKDEHGSLNYKVEWQSLDGRLCHLFFGNYFHASKHHSYLSRLGRKSKIYADITGVIGINDSNKN